MVWQGSAGNRCPYADQTGFQVTFSGLPPSGGEVTEKPDLNEAARAADACACFESTAAALI